MSIRTAILFGWVAAAGLPVAMAGGADWPTWRCDAARSASSPEELPDQLHLAWTRELAAPAPAWPNEPRLHFDAAYQPVIAGGVMLIGSPNDGSVRAYETRSGAEMWTFFTEGPVRFAPALAGGRAYVGSDDGWLYCLDVADGRLRWKVRAAPEHRPDRRHLGNNRLISFWPVRGGPVVVERSVYFAAGIWPTLGVFVVAVDSDSGKLLWRNGDLSLIDDVRLDHNDLRQSGLSPQGYLLAVGDKLLVPNGRSMPAALDRHTGKLLYYVQGYRNGDCRVTTDGRFAFVGASGVTDVGTGREVGSRWAEAGADAPDHFVGAKMHLFEGPIFPYKMIPGCSARSVLSGHTAYGLHQGSFYAYDLGRTAVSEYEKKHAGHVQRPWRWEAPLVWKLPSKDASRKPAGDALVGAGRRLYGHMAGRLVAVDLPATAGEPPRIAWAKALDGTPAELVAADGRLFAVTREGRIHCFGAEKVDTRVYALQSAPLPEVKDAWTEKAGEILERTGSTEGYCVVMGIGSGRLIDELLRQSKLRVIAVDADKTKVNALRTRLIAAGLYGGRADVLVGQPGVFSYPPYLGSLIVSEDWPAAGFSTDRLPPQLLEAIRPYGGVACLDLPAGMHDAAVRWAADSGIENLEVRRSGQFTLVTRRGPLAGSASWTHECADAARSFYSRDERVKPPLGILWYGDGPGYGFWKRKDYGIGVKPQVIGGRLVAFQVASRTLTAYDVYTGRLLWTRKTDPFTRYVTMRDVIYVAEGGRCLVLDSATGKPRASYDYAVEGNPALFVSDIRVSDDLILIAAARQKVRVIERGLWDSTVLIALDRTSGKRLWAREAKDRFNNNAIALGAGRVFCIDSVSPIESAVAGRRGGPPETLPSTILALDARTGGTLWTKVMDNPYRTYGIGNWLGIRGNDDWLAWCAEADLLLIGKQRRSCALRAADGKEIWRKAFGAQPWVLRGATFVHQGGQVIDVRSGKPLGKSPPIARGGCNYLVGNSTMLFIRERSVSYFDLAGGTKCSLFAVRSGCSNSLVAADGLLNVPNFAVGCVCNYPIQTSFAMMHAPEVAGWAASRPARASAGAEPHKR